MQSDTSRPNSKNSPVLVQRSDGAQSDQKSEAAAKGDPKASKFSPTYWESKVERRNWKDGEGTAREVAEWYMRVAWGGKQKRVPLGTNNRQEAGRKAARFYGDVRAHGWEEALRRLDPERAAAQERPDTLSLGEYAGTVRALGILSEKTVAGYEYGCRWFAAGILEAKRDRSRFDYVKGGSKAWREKLDAIPVSKLTANAAEGVMARFVEAAGPDPRKRRKAAQSANSFARNARALFGRKILRKLSIPLPAPLPFAGLEFLEAGSTRYVSTFNATELLSAARAELREADPDSWLALLLALGAGLRRGEIDALTWTQVRPGESAIWIGPTEHWKPKTATSEGLVHVDAFVMDELAARYRQAADNFVIRGLPAFPKHGTRCEFTFTRLTAWLRTKGVDTEKPLHTLRKEFGSIVTQTADIFTASRQLRHGDISTTARYYAENRRKVAPALGAMLGEIKPSS
jgi:integrase